MADNNKMNIIEALKKLRDDIIKWVTNNLIALSKKIDDHNEDTSAHQDIRDNTSNAFENFRDEISKVIVSEQAEFIVVDEDGNKAFEVDAEGTTHVKAITVDGVDILGDISTALDSILTQTATIIGGNS